MILLDGILQHQGAEINESHVVTNNINECPNVTHLKLKVYDLLYVWFSE